MIVEELFEILAGVFQDHPAQIVGRVIDEIGVPVANAEVTAEWSGTFAGTVAASATTDAEGSFALSGAFPEEFFIVVRSQGLELRLPEVRQPPLDLGELRLHRPLQLITSVGDAGENRPQDLRRVQDWLHRLGRLSDEDVAAEPIDLDAAPPVVPGPRLLAKLSAHLEACFGRRLPVTRVESTGPTADALAALPPFPLTRLALDTPVGDLAGADPALPLNAPASFRRAQERLYQLGLLGEADLLAEMVDPGAEGPVDPATKPQTLAAIRDFERRAAIGSLHALVPDALTERRLDDPPHFGRRPLELSGSVGAGASNWADDVARVQDRLLELGHLAPADHAAERVDPSAGTEPAYVADQDIPRTIAAIQVLRQSRLGQPGPGVVEIDDPSIAYLNRPPRLQLTDSIGEDLALPAGNRPANVRQFQERLLLIGFLSPQAFEAEKADPRAIERIDPAALPQTLAAADRASQQRTPLNLASTVGVGETNAPGDVRAVQDRVHGLGFLSDADYTGEIVDPLAIAVLDEASIGATLAALATLRETIFALPPGDPALPWTAVGYLEPGDETHRFLDDPVCFGRHPLRLAASVGASGANLPRDVWALQVRLRDMRLLDSAAFDAEAVDPAQPGRIDDEDLTATREAIRQLRETLLGAAVATERIEPRSPELRALDDPIGALRVDLDLTNSVGRDGVNLPADVVTIQGRLHGLGFLDANSFALESEAVPAEGATTLREAQIPATLAAINSWQDVMLGELREAPITPFSETRDGLTWPVLPRRAELPIGDSVGAGAVNLSADVRLAQDRLYEFGLLEAEDYVVERVDAVLAGNAPEGSLVATIVAIERLQQTVAGSATQAPDRRIEPDGHSARILADPAASTPTLPNPSCDFPSAGPAPATFDSDDLMNLIQSIEAEARNVSSGELPATLQNASGTRASWGASQVTGARAVEILADPAKVDFAAFYDLAGPTLQDLGARSAATVALFDQITAAVAVGTTEADLQIQIAAYVGAQAGAVRAATGLGPADIERMFRAAQLRHHLAALGPDGDAASLFDAVANPDAAANLGVLGLHLSDVSVYQEDPAADEEHRQGFATRALFRSPEGQIVRNALTDDSGFRIGRFVISDLWDSTAGLGLATRDRAQLTAYLQRYGGDPATLAGETAEVAADAYVQRVMARYDAIP